MWVWLRNGGEVKFNSCHCTSMAITPVTLGKNEKYISNKWFHKKVYTNKNFIIHVLQKD